MRCGLGQIVTFGQTISDAGLSPSDLPGFPQSSVYDLPVTDTTLTLADLEALSPTVAAEVASLAPTASTPPTYTSYIPLAVAGIAALVLVAAFSGGRR